MILWLFHLHNGISNITKTASLNSNILLVSKFLWHWWDVSVFTLPIDQTCVGCNSLQYNYSAIGYHSYGNVLWQYNFQNYFFIVFPFKIREPIDDPEICQKNFHIIDEREISWKPEISKYPICPLFLSWFKFQHRVGRIPWCTQELLEKQIARLCWRQIPYG